MFGADTNGKGFKVPQGCGVIQGDGVTYEGIVKILDAVLDAGFSAEARSHLAWLVCLVSAARCTCSGWSSVLYVRVCSLCVCGAVCSCPACAAAGHVQLSPAPQWSAATEACELQAVAFGMGGGLLQKVNRDTMSFATKLSHIVYADGTQRDIMKAPSGDTSKASLPGQLGAALAAMHALRVPLAAGVYKAAAE